MFLFTSLFLTISTTLTILKDPDDYQYWFHQYDDIIDQIKEWTSAQENLDVYQMNSFYAGISNKRKQVLNYYKTAMVFFIQTAGAGYLAYNQFTTPSSEGTVCIRLLRLCFWIYLNLNQTPLHLTDRNFVIQKTFTG